MTRRRSHSWYWLFRLLGGASFALLLYVDSLLLQAGPAPRATVSLPTADWQADFPNRIDRVTEALARLPVPLPAPNEEPQGAASLRWVHRRYELTLPRPHQSNAVEQMLDGVRTAAEGVTLQVTPQPSGAQVQIGVDGLLTHTVTFHWLDRHPRVALIIDQLGDDLLVARAFAGISVPLTFAVMPFRPFSKEVAELARLFGREVLLQFPGEPEAAEAARPEIMSASARSDPLREIDRDLTSVPYVIGVSDMDSRLSGDPQQRKLVLDALKQRKLFLLDGRSAATSTVCEVAATTAVACAAPSRWFDDSDDGESIDAQAEALLSFAGARADTIAVVHPRLSVAPALEKLAPRFAAADIDIVPVTAMLRAQASH
jgi:polysaccharide deacetylase 2 family uncharacterized protein YibQ